MSKLTSIKIEEIKTKAKNKDIYLDNEFLALNKYIEINDDDINRLKKWNIDKVYIEDGDTQIENKTNADFGKFLRDYKVFKKIYFNLIKKVRNCLGGYRHNNLVNIKELNEIIDESLDIINRNLNSVIQLFNIVNLPKADEYYIRSLNVSMISMIIGLSIKLSEDRVKKLGIGAMLYDIGLVKIPDSILSKVIEKFSLEEYTEIKKHTVYGYKIIKDSFRLEEDIATISLTHHEFVNGKGYPRGITGDKIHLYAKIVAISHSIEKTMKSRRIELTNKKSDGNKSIFNLMLEKSSSNKKKDVYLSDAIKEIQNNVNIKYDPVIVKAFIGVFTIYPIGTIVLLNDNRKALVFATNSKFNIRPIIKIVSNEEGNFIENGEVINLTENNKLFIKNADKNYDFFEEVQNKIFPIEDNNAKK